MTKARTLADNFAADINGITAGTGITGGGTSGTVTVTNSMATAIDAKGDLVVGTGADTFSRLAVASTAGYLLSVDSAESTGLKWAAPAAGAGMTLITRQTITNSSGTNIDSVFTSTYRSYIIVVEEALTGNSPSSSSEFHLQFLYGSTTLASDYKYREIDYGGNYSSLERNGLAKILISKNIGDGNQSNAVWMQVSKVGNTSERAYFAINDINAYNGIPLFVSGYANSSQTYTGLRFTTISGNFNATIAIYGLAKS